MSRTPVEAIDSYITDMLALEEHYSRTLKAQVKDFEDDQPTFAAELNQIVGVVDQHVETLKSLADARGSTGGKIAEAVKRAGSMVASVGSAAVDMLRSEKLPKNLRDDYTASSLATIGYVMLYTTAVALSDTAVAKVAYDHLKDYAKATMRLHDLIPATVVSLLEEEGLMPKTDALTSVHAELKAVWEDGSDANRSPSERAGSARI